MNDKKTAAKAVKKPVSKIKPQQAEKQKVVKHQEQQAASTMLELTHAAKQAAVRADRQRCTSIEVERQDAVVTYLFFTAEGVDVARLDAKKYEDRFNLPLPDYPLLKAINHYLAFATRLGATHEAMGWLAKLINRDITKEIEMATTKKKTYDKKEAAASYNAAVHGAGKPAAKKTAAAGSPAKKPAVKKSTEKKPTGEKRESAAQMFQDLIMEGKLTDDQIFKKVQTKFGLDDNKRGYVKWYRNHLEKQGKKPPKAKE